MTNPATAPTLSLAADKQTYKVGDPITVTATYSDEAGATATLTISATATDDSGNTAEASLDVQVSLAEHAQAMQVAVTDSFGDVYAEQSNDSVGTAIFTSTIGTPPASA